MEKFFLDGKCGTVSVPMKVFARMYILLNKHIVPFSTDFRGIKASKPSIDSPAYKFRYASQCVAESPLS